MYFNREKLYAIRWIFVSFSSSFDNRFVKEKELSYLIHFSNNVIYTIIHLFYSPTLLKSRASNNEEKNFNFTFLKPYK